MDLAAFSPHLTALTKTRVSGTGWRQPSSQRPQAQRKEEEEWSLTDPRSQSSALIPALPALCFATRTGAPTSPQSLTPRPCQGESGQRQGRWTRHHSHPHPRCPVCLMGFPTALPMLQPQEMAGSGGTLLPWPQTYTRSSQTACVGHKLLTKQLGSLPPFHYLCLSLTLDLRP